MSVHDVLLIGGSNVGKTALTRRYLWNYWEETYSPAFMKLYLESKINLYSKSNMVNGKANTVRVITIEDSSRKPSWFTNHGMVICVYDITNEASFTRVQHLLDDLRTSLGTKKFTLVGNKADLTKERQVSAEEGQELANRCGATFFETSAKNDTNVGQAFANEADVSILVKKDDMNVRQAIANEADVSILVKFWYCMTAWMCCVGR